jgi:hypothetical protein
VTTSEYLPVDYYRENISEESLPVKGDISMVSEYK